MLLRHVSGTFHPLEPMTPAILTTKVGQLKRVQDFDIVSLCDPKVTTSVLAIRGGGIGEIASDINEYIGASKGRSWAVLVFSILADTIAVTLIKAAQTESSIHKLVLGFFGFFLSLIGFSLALKSIDMSVAYAIWASFGTAIVSIAGVVFFGERLDMAKVVCLSLIVIGVVGLEITDSH